MKISEWLKYTFGKENILEVDSTDFGTIAQKIIYKEIALNSAINLISKAISNSEFKTYEIGKEKKDYNYYLFNIEPNNNQNASEFWTDFIYHLINDNEVLVIQESDQLFVAESFDKMGKTLKKSVFFNVTIKMHDETIAMNKRYSSDDVIYARLNNKNIKKMIDELYVSYGELISIGIRDYQRQNGIRGKLKIAGMFAQRYKDQESLQNYIKQKFKNYFESINAVLPLEDGLDFTETNSTKNQISISEVQKGIEGAFDYVAIALNIPKGIMKGDLTEIKLQMNNFLTFCVDPIANMIDREFNRKYFKKDKYLEGTYLKTDTSRVEHINIFDVAGSMDVLTRIGYSPDEVRALINQPKTNEPWAQAHYITKNYQDMKGGNNDE